SMFSMPRNLGYPLNTHNDEQGLHIDAAGTTGYFSSARDSLKGLDIYSFQVDPSIRPHPATWVKAFVTNAETGNPVQAEIHLQQLASITTEARVEKTNPNGEALICMPAGQNYAFSVTREGYLF